MLVDLLFKVGVSLGVQSNLDQNLETNHNLSMNTPNTKISKISYKDRILQCIIDGYEVAPNEIIFKTGISQQTVHNNLKKLLAEGSIVKNGSGLDVVYYSKLVVYQEGIESLKNIIKNKESNLDEFSERTINFLSLAGIGIIDQHYTYISPEGNIYDGVDGLRQWSQRQNPKQTEQEFAKLCSEYLSTILKYDKYKNENGLIDATNKFQTTFPQYTDLEKVFYCDFYSIERFGKTKLGNLMFYGKQSQNKKLIKDTCEIVKPLILDFIKQNNISAVAFVPPTISRDLQFMTGLAKFLNLNIPTIKLKKLVNEVAVQQKTIKNAGDRIINAQNIVVEMNPSYENVLILDDAVGSGSTFAVVARKLRQRKVALGKIYALAIVGSANGVIDTNKKGFEVVGEV